MILFTLICHHKHQFEGWFRNNEAYETQSRDGTLSCPMCGTPKVNKAPMAPRIGKSVALKPTEKSKKNINEANVTPAPAEQNVSVAGVSKKPNLYKILRQLRQEIEKNADDVGASFAEEARKIHFGESMERPIYGTATNHETKQLKDEGIDFIEVPWLPKTND